MKILVLYFLPWFKIRKTREDHLFCFRRYAKGADFHYFNAFFGIPGYLTKIDYDAVILDYSFFDYRWEKPLFVSWYRKAIAGLKNLKGLKVAAPQDEHAFTGELRWMIREGRIGMVLTLAQEKDWDVLYPDRTAGARDFVTILPGYVDSQTLARVRDYCLPDEERVIDIGYRGRKLSYSYGRHAYTKYEMGERVSLLCWRHYPDLRVDISSREEDVFYGDDWLKFLGRCKAVLGCEGGARIMDADGSLWDRCQTYAREHPEASFDEVERACLRGREGAIDYLAVSPRHFEACIARTCQVLVEGEYSGVMKSGVHYIALKRDYSNLDEVIAKIRDRAYRQKIAENAYRDLIASGRYSYETYANQVMEHIRRRVKQTSGTDTAFCFLKGWLAVRARMDGFFKVLFHLWYVYGIYGCNRCVRLFGGSMKEDGA